jgi:tRNA(adenine34) deaminase
MAQNHDHWMQKALELAAKAGSLLEVPVGAIVVQNNEIIGEGWNTREGARSCLGHAELMAITQASQKLGAWRLLDCTLYVTLEPCVMCSGALVQSRIPKVIYGAKDPKGGALESLYQIGTDPRLNHRIEILGGVLERECSGILSDFFKKRREEKTK